MIYNLQTASEYVGCDPHTIKKNIVDNKLNAIVYDRGTKKGYFIEEKELQKYKQKYHRKCKHRIRISLTDEEYNILCKNLNNDSISVFIGDLLCNLKRQSE